QSVVVRVNDRGPFHASRIIDLSYTAALKLGLIGTGSGSVEVERVFSDNTPDGKLALQATVPANAATPNSVAETGALYIQLGAFGTLNSTESFRDKVQQDLAWLAEAIQILFRDGLYRVRLGPYGTRTEANAIAEKIRVTLDFAPQIASQ
ncbi:MAG: SPOR domain-containing protein, partial [Pseudonocardiaceae bacterium]